MQLIGVVSDTHGLLRPEVKEVFRGCSLIIHAGDVGKAEVLKELGEIANVIAIKGNIDKGELAEKLNQTEQLKILNSNIFIIHDTSQLKMHLDFPADIIIYGHSHKAEIKKSNNILYFNPGSAGPRRFRLPVTLGLLKVTPDKVEPEIIQLKVD